ncbi:MAG: response regulator [Rickettsiales bacterium]|nr:response regulator [Rickettsiales bacterium]
MDTYEQNNALSLEKIAEVLRKDPESWVKWNAIHISTGTKELPPYYPEEEIRNTIQRATDNLNSKSYLLQDGDILIIACAMPVAQLRLLAKELVDVLHMPCEEEATFRLYHLADDHQRFAFCCEAKAEVLSIKVGEATANVTDGIIEKDEVELDTLEMVEETSKILSRHPMFSRFEEERLHKKVLVVEDDSLTRRMVGKVLQGDDSELITAEDAYEALAHYVVHTPDIVFVDIGLPGKDGKALLRMLLEYDPSANIVMFSSNNYIENIVETISSGASGFVGKPFHKEQLLHYINKAG